MYQQTRNESFLRQNVITKVAANMTRVGYLARPNIPQAHWSREVCGWFFENCFACRCLRTGSCGL